MGLPEYRQAALSAMLDATRPHSLFPRVPSEAKSVLDVGCHAGHILEAMQLPADCRVVGCDINREALRLAHRCLPGASFLAAKAETLPFASASFDVLFARSVTYVLDIPKALQEFNRVLKPGGRLWLSLHQWKDCRVILKDNWKRHRLKAISLGIYILADSALLHHTGRLFRYPLNRSRLISFQTESRFLRTLQTAGFSDIHFSRDRCFVVEAVKKTFSPVVLSQAA